MKYLIYKTSEMESWKEGKEPTIRPHEKAFVDSYDIEWLFVNKIKNETVNGWFIEIDSLEELMDLFKLVTVEHTEGIIITKAFGNSDIPALEIYDSYRE